MKLLTSILTALLFVACQRSLPTETKVLSDMVKTKCMICHDNAEMQRGPVLNGLQADYMLEQINKFKQGLRGTHQYDHQGALMLSAVQNMDDETIRKAVAEIAEIAPRQHLVTVRGDEVKGEVMYESKCKSCHAQWMYPNGCYQPPQCLCN